MYVELNHNMSVAEVYLTHVKDDIHNIHIYIIKTKAPVCTLKEMINFKIKMSPLPLSTHFKFQTWFIVVWSKREKAAVNAR